MALSKSRQWRLLVIVLVSLVKPISSQAEMTSSISPIKYTVSMPGTCRSAEISGDFSLAVCDRGLIHTMFMSGRSVFSFRSSTGKAVTFSGGKDEQPDPLHYNVDLDSVYTIDEANPTLQQDKIPVTGQCRVAGDPTRSAKIHCEAKAVSTGARYVVVYEMISDASYYTNPQASRTENQKLVDHCISIRLLGTYLGEARQIQKNPRESVEFATSRMVAEQRFEKSDKLTTIASAYWLLISRLEQFKPETTGAYAMAACMTIHGLKLYVPSDAENEQKINSMLRHCETSSQTRDELGMCVLNTVKPIVIKADQRVATSHDVDAGDMRTIESIKKVFATEAVKQGIYGLYRQQLATNPNLAGKVVLRITVTKEGSVTRAVVTESTVRNERFEKELTGLVARVSFGKVNASAPVTFSYPLEFLPDRGIAQ